LSYIFYSFIISSISFDFSSIYFFNSSFLKKKIYNANKTTIDNTIFHIFFNIISAFPTKKTQSSTIATARIKEPIIFAKVKDVLCIQELQAIKGTNALKRL